MPQLLEHAPKSLSSKNTEMGCFLIGLQSPEKINKVIRPRKKFMAAQKYQRHFLFAVDKPEVYKKASGQNIIDEYAVNETYPGRNLMERHIYRAISRNSITSIL